MLRYQNLTLERVAKLIDENIEAATKQRFRLSWGVTKTGIYGRIVNQKNYCCYEKQYKGAYFHLLYAEMHADFATFLESERMIRRHAIQKAWNQRKFDRKQAAEELTEAQRVETIRKQAYEKYRDQSPFEKAIKYRKFE